MQIIHHRTRNGLRTVLMLDAVFEFVCAVGLVVGAASLGPWLAVGAGVSIAIGAVFAAAGAGIVSLVRGEGPKPTIVRSLAFANIAGGTAAWLIFVAFWLQFEPAGRAILGSGGDCLLVLGVLELRALRSH